MAVFVCELKICFFLAAEAIELMLDNLEKKMVVRKKRKKNFKRLVKRKFVTFSVRKQDEHRKIEFCKASTEKREKS